MARSRSSARAAGSRMERVVADCLQEHVSEFIDRKVRTGARDTGDIGNVRTSHNLKVTVEVKDVVSMSLGTWVAEAETERVNAGDDVAWTVHKRRGKGDPLDQYLTMTLRDGIALITGVRPD